MSAFLLQCPSQIICGLSCTTFKGFHHYHFFQEISFSELPGCSQGHNIHSSVRPQTHTLYLLRVKYHFPANSAHDRKIGQFPYFLCPPCHLSKQKCSLSHLLSFRSAQIHAQTQLTPGHHELSYAPPPTGLTCTYAVNKCLRNSRSSRHIKFAMEYMGSKRKGDSQASGL